MPKGQLTTEQRQQQTITRLKRSNLKLKETVKEIPILREEIRDLKLQIEELKKIIFGEKNKDNNRFDYSNHRKSFSEKKPRSKDSYKRELPNSNEITNTKEHLIESCPDCKTHLTRKKIIIYYEEDISLPDKDKQLKEVVEHRVEKGYCSKCQKWKTAIKLPPKKVVLGKKVKFYICYLNILLRLSYSQIQSLLRDTYHFKISHGEIENVLENTGKKLRKEFEKIKKNIQQERGVHMDETSWGNLYLWVMASIDNTNTIYHVGNRGNGNVDKLIGEDFVGIRISDDYPAYKNKSGVPQQCWAHPHRKLRDLAYSSTLDEETRKHCLVSYQEFEEIYSKLRAYISEIYESKKREKQKEELLSEIRVWKETSSLDPKKLQNIKKQFLNEIAWLNCLDYEDIPCDNNKAERALRHFVIKRKISFGTKTERTSETFSILASVFMTYWKKYQDTFFERIMALD